MTNQRLSWYSGSDTYLYTLGKELVKQGHSVSVFSEHISSVLQGRRFEEAGITVLSKLNNSFSVIQKSNDFDVIHGQHNTTVSIASTAFPKVPVIFVSHGVLPKLEKIPRDVDVSKFIAVSEEVFDQQFKDVSSERKLILRNMIDTDRFCYSTKKVGKRLRILVVSNYFHNEWSGKEVWDAAKLLDADVDVIGTNGQLTFNAEDAIRKCDVAIGLGRSILACMSMGKPVIVGDYAGYDGAINRKSYLKIRQTNFSSRANKEQWDGKKLAKEISKIFAGDYIKLGKVNRDIILEHHNAKTIASKFLEIYQSVL